MRRTQQKTFIKIISFRKTDMSASKNSDCDQSGLHNTENASFPENQNSPVADAEEQYPVHLFTFGQSSYRPASFIPHQKETLSKDKPNPFATIAEVGDGSSQFFKPPSTQQTAAPTWRMEYSVVGFESVMRCSRRHCSDL